jgi:hypothetical protein
MVQISNEEYANLVGAKGALSEALKGLADVVEACQRSGGDCVPVSLEKISNSDVADAVNHARVTLANYAV